MSTLLRVTAKFPRTKGSSVEHAPEDTFFPYLFFFIPSSPVKSRLPLGAIQVGSWNYSHPQEDHFRHASDSKKGQVVAVCRERSQGRGRPDHGPYPGYLRVGTV